MMSIEPMVLVATVPGEVAGTVATAGAVAIGALWRRLVFVEDRARADKVEMMSALAEATSVMTEVARELSEWRRSNGNRAPEVA